MRKRGSFLRGELRFVLGWHLPEIHLVQGIMPSLGPDAVHHVGVQLIQSQLALLFFGTVTAKAQLGQNWFHMFFESIQANGN